MFDPRKALLLTALLFVLPSGEARAQSLDVFRLGPADEIEISVWEEPTLSSRVVVRPDGKISLPLIGTVDVAGRTPEEVGADLQQRFLDYLKTDDPIFVVVVVSAIHSSQISVIGEVRNPGRFPLEQRLSVLEAIAGAGGFSDYADIDNVLVLRPEETGDTLVYRRIRVNVKELLEKDTQSLMMLLPGDIVYVK